MFDMHQECFNIKTMKNKKADIQKHIYNIRVVFRKIGLGTGCKGRMR